MSPNGEYLLIGSHLFSRSVASGPWSQPACHMVPPQTFQFVIQLRCFLDEITD